MIEQIYSEEGVYNLFKKYNAVTENNCFFYGLYEKPIKPAEIAAAVFLTGVINAAGANVIGVQQLGISYPSYLINQNDKGIAMIPLEVNAFTTQFPINKMKIVDNVCIFINKDDIKSVQVKRNPLCLKPSIRFVKIDTKNGEIFNFRVSQKDKFLSFQEKNFHEFMKKYI